MTPPHIQRAERKDIPALLKYMASRAEVDEAWLLQRIEALWDNWVVFIALDHDDIVGFVAAAQDRDLMGVPFFIVHHINVIRSGIARRLMAKVTDMGKTVWMIAPATEAHIRLARGFGFSQVGVVLEK